MQHEAIEPNRPKSYLIGYMTQTDLNKQASAIIPTKYGDWDMIAYASTPDSYVPHLVLKPTTYDPSNVQVPIVRIHSECITGDLFGSIKCDCGEQLEQSMKLISEKGGFIIYLRQEGRGIGIIEKLKAYKLQEAGADTIDANTMLGHQADSRKYDIALNILADLGVTTIDLLTNNPEKLQAVDDHDIILRNRIPLVISPRKENEGYLRTKRDMMGHLLKD